MGDVHRLRKGGVRQRISPSKASKASKDHLKIGRISCTDATIKLKVDINRRAKGAFNELKFGEKGRE